MALVLCALTAQLGLKGMPKKRKAKSLMFKKKKFSVPDWLLLPETEKLFPEVKGLGQVQWADLVVGTLSNLVGRDVWCSEHA